MSQPHVSSEQLAAAHALLARGEKAEALEVLKKILVRDPEHIRTLYTLSHFATAEEAEQLIEHGATLLEKKENDPELYFALGNLYHLLERYEEAFKQYDIGNKIKRVEVPSTSSRYRQHVDILLQAYTAERIKRIDFNGSNSNVPIFILGISRGGKSLVEHFLAQHPDVHDAKELNLVAPWLSEPNKLPANRHTDPYGLFALEQEEADLLILEALAKFCKGSRNPRHVAITTPANHRYLPLLATLFPKAKVIHCRRNPLDQCLQMYFTCYRSGNSHSYSWDDLHSYYDCYQRMTLRWQELFPLDWLEVDYEQLVTTPETVVNQLFEFTNLPNGHLISLTDFYGDVLNRDEIGLGKCYEDFLPK